MRKINRLNEEIARWAFEIRIKSSNIDWRIAFTNPTAGPWKTIKAKALKTEEIGEVYRFILEEDRPDIVMYNDFLKTVIIFEAKDNLDKLMESSQATKSSEVVSKLGKILSGKSDNKFWCGREKYNIVLGLLWGSVDNEENCLKIDSLFDQYHSLIKDMDCLLQDYVVGIETLYKDEELICGYHDKIYDGKYTKLALDIKKSLKL